MCVAVVLEGLLQARFVCDLVALPSCWVSTVAHVARSSVDSVATSLLRAGLGVAPDAQLDPFRASLK